MLVHFHQINGCTILEHIIIQLRPTKTPNVAHIATNILTSPDRITHGPTDHILLYKRPTEVLYLKPKLLSS